MAKVISLHLSVIHSVHRGEGVCLSACWDTTPPGSDTTPPDQADPHGPGKHPHPPGPGRHPPDQADTPPRTRQTPPREQTPAYGLRAAGTHPTGMHSCLFLQRHRSKLRTVGKIMTQCALLANGVGCSARLNSNVFGEFYSWLILPSIEPFKMPNLFTMQRAMLKTIITARNEVGAR